MRRRKARRKLSHVVVRIENRFWVSSTVTTRIKRWHLTVTLHIDRPTMIEIINGVRMSLGAKARVIFSLNCIESTFTSVHLARTFWHIPRLWSVVYWETFSRQGIC